ncbi:olfactory receptor 472-like [Xenopus tropicalis]|nr:olfactory receptor 472-like [Xenopus tropicalis]
MAYDRYVAICHPLLYVSRMSQKHCIYLLSVAWAVGFLDPTSYFFLISKFSFCSSVSIDHFFCDFETLLKLSCSNTFYVEILNYLEGALVTLNTFILTVASYIFIILAILNIKSAEGRHKAFSTCTSHLTCVIIFYFTIISLYIRPISTYSPKQGKFFALFYIIVIPLLNPYIYTLKNNEFHVSLRKLKRSRFFYFTSLII